MSPTVKHSYYLTGPAAAGTFLAAAMFGFPVSGSGMSPIIVNTIAGAAGGALGEVLYRSMGHSNKFSDRLEKDAMIGAGVGAGVGILATQVQNPILLAGAMGVGVSGVSYAMSS